jgi:hypothetical protein
MVFMIFSEIRARKTPWNQRRLKYVAEQLAKLPAWEAERARICAPDGPAGKGAARPVVNVSAEPEGDGASPKKGGGKKKA